MDTGKKGSSEAAAEKEVKDTAKENTSKPKDTSTKFENPYLD